MERKIRLDETLGLHLKEFRTQYKVKGKDIAEHLGKSAAYISKLEKGQIQQIEKTEFVKITNFITKSEDGYFIFCEKVIKLTDMERVRHDCFWLNFDWIERKIPVVDGIVDEIKEKINNLGVTVEELTNYINQNEDLGPKFFEEHKIDYSSVEKNVWTPYQEADSIEHPHSFIVLEYSTQRVEAFLNGEIQKCEYMFPFAILYHLIKLEYKKNGKQIDEKIVYVCQTETQNILLKHKFYSMSVQTSLEEQGACEDDYKKLLNSYDLKNIEYVSEIISAIDFLSKYDVEYANRKLKSIVENFKNCDLSFAIAFMSISLTEMKDLQTSLKKEFLAEVRRLVEKYSNMTNSSENIEKY